MVYTLLPDLWCTPFSLVSQGNGIHLSIFCTVTGRATDRERRGATVVVYTLSSIQTPRQKATRMAETVEKRRALRNGQKKPKDGWKEAQRSSRELRCLESQFAVRSDSNRHRLTAI